MIEPIKLSQVKDTGRYAGGIGRKGGDDGTIPPMDSSARLDAMDARLTSVELKLDMIEHEVSGLKWWLLGSVITIIITVVATVVGTGIGIQQMTVATFQAASQQAAPPPSQQPTVIVVPTAPAPAAPPPPTAPAAPATPR